MRDLTVLAWFRRNLSPTLLSGLTLRDWVRLLRDNRFDIDTVNIPRAAVVTALSISNSLFGFFENRRYRMRIEQTEVPPPLFVMGSARSGTTLLHTVLSQDPRFASPNLFQVQFPHIFLSTERWMGPLLRPFLPRQRLLDQVKVSLEMAGEDEFALAATSLCSPYLGHAFPRQRDRYVRFLAMEDVTAAESERWDHALLYFLKKLTLRHGRPLVLKSPPHYCRTRRLLRLFPEARFVHIHRHPFSVMQSKYESIRRVYGTWSLQRSAVPDREGQLELHRDICERFLHDRQLIPPGQLHELAYEDFVSNPLGELAAIYRRLDLPDFDAVRPAHRAHLASIAGYRANRHDELSPEQKEHIYSVCRSLFEAWGYDYNLPAGANSR